MRFLELVYFHNTLRAWLLALGAALVYLLLLKLFQRVVLHRISKFAERTDTRLDDILVAVLGSTRLTSVILLSLGLAGKSLAFTPAVERYVSLGLVLVLLFQGALWVATAIDFLLNGAIERRKEEDAGSVTALKAMGIVAKVVLWTLFLLLVLHNLGVNITGLVAGLGVGGIALALAVQNILGDLFASLSIVLDKPFAVGDFIIVDDFSGTVEHIGLKTTRVRSLAGEQIIFSNSDLLKSRIRNYKRMEERRVVLSYGVTHQTPHDLLAALPAMLREIVESREKVRFDRSHFKTIGDSALVFETVYFMQDPDFILHMDTQQAIHLEFLGRCQALGIGLAYPTRTVYQLNLDAKPAMESSEDPARPM